MSQLPNDNPGSAVAGGQSVPEIVFDGTAEDAISPEKLETMAQVVATYGAAHYRWQTLPTDHQRAASRLASALRLVRHDQGVRRNSDGWAVLTAQPVTADQVALIPYSNRAMSWHTDGYYNVTGEEVRTFILHCIRAAASGGANRLMDSRIAATLLKEQDADAFHCLTHPSAMTVPAYCVDNTVRRPARSAPVICIEQSGEVFVRFTTRTQNIVWRNDATHRAALLLHDIIKHSSDYHLHVCLRAGEGIVSRNILHCRQQYEDSPAAPRKMLRARFLDSLKSDDAKRDSYD